MKKLVAIVAVSALLITGNISFALGTPPVDKPVKNVQATQAGEVGNDKKAIQTEIKTILQEIFADRQEVIDKKVEVHQAFIEAKKHVKELLKDKENLDSDQLLILEGKLQTIKEQRQSINNTVADVAKEIHTLRLAKKNCNIDEIKEIYATIEKLQKERIDKLTDVINVLNDITKI